MTWLVDLGVLAALGYSAYAASRRGLLLAAFELLSLLIATLAAVLVYAPAGSLVHRLLRTSLPLSNVFAFVVIWMLAETACALATRYYVFPRLAHQRLPDRPDRLAAAGLGAVKAAVLATLVLLLASGLPVSPAAKQALTGGLLSRHLLGLVAEPVRASLAGGLGHDLSQSLDFFTTVTAEPESEQRIDLGFQAAGRVDAAKEAAMLELLNHERTTRGLGPLALNPDARSVARAYSSDMLRRGFFSHVNPEGQTPFDRMRDAGLHFGSAGENLALAPTLQQAHDGLMKSPGHRANILNRDFRTVGIGVVDGGQYGLMVTQDFTD
jgi:uncharacterized protein YkwD/uncharacterized membrane protein required for colicin V production